MFKVIQTLRYYRESMAKMAECVAFMNDRKVDFLVEVGDFKDEGTPVLERDTLKYLEDIERIFGRFDGKRYHVLGNHDLDSISKEQFLSRVENTGVATGSKYYSLTRRDCISWFSTRTTGPMDPIMTTATSIGGTAIFRATNSTGLGKTLRPHPNRR